MNLVADPWIPVVWADGASSPVSLRDVFAQGAEIADLSVLPPERISLLNLFLAVAQRAIDGPLDGESHLSCRNSFANAALKYLDRADIKPAFELLGEHPRFLQIHGTGKPGKMALGKMGGVDEGGALLFQPALGQGSVFSPAWAALKVLTYQNYSPGGKVGGSAEFSGKSAPVSGRAGPRRDSNAVHGYFRGADLLQTIWLNMVPVSDLPANMPMGRPIWEVLAGLSKPDITLLKDNGEIVRSYLGRLVPLSRSLWLESDLACSEVTVGLDYLGFAEGTKDATLTTMRVVQKGKEAEVVLSCARGGRMLHVWRDLPAVLHVHRLDQGDVCMGPLAFRSFTRLMESEEMDIWLGGVGGDQASSVDLYESSYRVPARALLNQDTNVMWRKTYEAGIARADKVKVRLHGMVASWLVNSRPSLGASNSREARKQINALGSVAEIAYWSILQANHGILIAESNRAALGNTAAEGGEAWENICEQARLRAFSHACPGQTRLQTRARAMVQAGRRGPRS